MGTSVVAVVFALTHRHNLVRGQRAYSNHSEVNHLSQEKTITNRNDTKTVHLTEAS